MDAVEKAIVDSIAGMDGVDDIDTSAGSDDVVDTPVEAAAEPATEAATSEPTEGTTEPTLGTPAAEEDTLEALVGKDSRGRENRIPHSRVVKIVENAKKKAIAEREAARDAELRKTFGLADDAPLELAPIHDRLKTYEQQMANVERLIQESPERFIQHLAEINPAYAVYLQKPAATATEKLTQPTDEPEPDIDLGDGRRTYSLEGLRKREAWIREQAVKEAEERITKRFAPIEQQYKARTVATQAEQRANAMLAEAAAWEGFTEHKDEILAVLQNDKERKHTLDSAYRKVVIPKLRADREAMRKTLLEEINAKPKATAAPVAAAVPAKKADDGPRDLHDVIREAAQAKGII